jgi:GNAT superfamily N-acetyltransferase
VLAIQRAAYAIEAELIGYPELPPLRETLEALQATEEEIWVCCEGQELVGVVGLEHGAEEMVIARLFVAPPWFRRGIGSALVEHALARADGRRVRVGTGAKNAPALALYRRFGFAPEGGSLAAGGYVELVRDP